MGLVCCFHLYLLSDKNSGGHHFLPAFVCTPPLSPTCHCLCLPTIIWTLPLSFMFTDGATAAAVIAAPTCSHSYSQPFVFTRHHLHPPALVHVRRWSCCCCCGYHTHLLSFVFTAVCTCLPSFVITCHCLCLPTIVCACPPLFICICIKYSQYQQDKYST